MSVSRRLEAHRQSVALASADAPLPNTDPNPLDEGDEDEPTTSKKKGKEKDMNTVTQEAHDAAVASARADGFKEANARMNAVFAAPEYQGREASAHHKLTAVEYAGFTSEQITASLSKETKIEAVALDSYAVTASAEAAQAAVMQEAISANVNSAIDVSGGGAAAAANVADNTLVNSMAARFETRK